MPNPERAEDPRKARTKSALQRAALTLFQKKPIQEISVADIVVEAGVNRSSFYTHYTSLHELYADALEAAAIETAKRGGHSDGNDANREPGDLPEAIRDFIRHIFENSGTYRWALGPEGSPEIVYRLQERVRLGMAQGLEHHLGGSTTQARIAAQSAFLAGGVVGAITQWIMQDEPSSPEDFSAWLWAETRIAFASIVERATGEAIGRR